MDWCRRCGTRSRGQESLQRQSLVAGLTVALGSLQKCQLFLSHREEAKSGGTRPQLAQARASVLKGMLSRALGTTRGPWDVGPVPGSFLGVPVGLVALRQGWPGGLLPWLALVEEGTGSGRASPPSYWCA